MLLDLINITIFGRIYFYLKIKLFFMIKVTKYKFYKSYGWGL